MLFKYTPVKRFITLSALSFAIAAANSQNANAAPAGGGVTNGTAEITFDTNTTVIDQTSQNVSINWDSFNVASDEAVRFDQPNASSIAINNITNGTDSPSKILGSITSNGQVFLSNPNGFLFGAGSSINTGSFLATTSNMAMNLEDFEETTLNEIDNKLILTNPTEAAIIIQGSDGSGLDAASITTREAIGDKALNRDESFIAIFSSNISNSGNLTAQDSSIFLSDKNTGTIKLYGLDIGIDINDLTASKLGVNLSEQSGTLKTGSDNYIVLSTTDFSTVIQSAIKNPDSLSDVNFQKHLENYNVSVYGNDLTLAGSNPISTTIDDDQERTLSFIATGDLEILSSIQNKNLNLVLDSQNISIGKINSSVSLGGGDNGNGLKSIDISTHIDSDTQEGGVTTLYTGMKAFHDIKIDSNIHYGGNDNSSQLLFNTVDSDGTISFFKHIESKDTDAGIIIESNTINLAGINDFKTVELDASIINFNQSNSQNTSYINATSISTRGNSELYLNTDVTLTASEIDLSGVSLASYEYGEDTNKSSYSLTLNSGGTDGQFKLSNINDSSAIGSENLTTIDGLIIESAVGTSSNLYISGNLTANSFIAGEKDKGSLVMTLSDGLNINNVSEFDTQNAVINGSYALNINSGSSNSTAKLGRVSDTSLLTSVAVNDFNAIYLSEDINVSSGDITLAATNIYINKFGSSEASSQILNIANNSNANISLTGNTLTENSSGLNIGTFNGNVSIGKISNLNSFSINKSLMTEGEVLLKGDISVTDNINLSNLGDINIGQDITLSANTFNSTSSHILSPANHLQILTSKQADIGSLSANNITIVGSNEAALSNTNLYGDVLATDKLALLNTSIVLQADLSLSGDINFLDAPALDENNKPTINGHHKLYINASNSDIYVYDFGSTDSLDSLTIKGNGNISFTDMPNIIGTNGLSLLGDLKLYVEKDKTFNYDGNIDLSGTTINGSGTLTFTSLNGDISLGTIGNDSEISSLTINSSGKLNLHGDITLTEPIYDFSGVSAIQIHQDMTFGSSDVAAVVDFGDATLDGTYGLTLFSDQLTLGTIGSNIALQDLTIYSNSDLTLKNNITMVGSANINAESLTLENTITTTGLNIDLNTNGNLTMSSTAILNADSGDINLVSSSGDISIGEITALENVNINAQAGSIFNSINDYVSNTSTSTNITSKNQDLNALNKIGSDVNSPIVINAQDGGSITVQANQNIYIANLSNSEVSSRSTVIDSGAASGSAESDAYSQFKLSSINQVNTPTVTSNAGLISNLTWQADEEESVRKLKTPVTAPPIYHSRKGWRLGY